MRLQTGRSDPEKLITIDDRIFAFFCKTMLFFVFGHRSSNTHLDQLIQAFYRAFSHSYETESVVSNPVARSILLL